MKRLPLALAAAVVIVLLIASPAWAAPKFTPPTIAPTVHPIVPTTINSCAPSAPIPSMQDGTTQGLLDPGPAPSGDSLYSLGGEGASWSEFDLGCLGAAGQPAADVDTMLGDALYSLAKGLVATQQGFERMVTAPNFLGSLDPLVTKGVDAFRSSVFDNWIPASLVLLGVLIALSALRGSLSGAMKAAGWALLVMGLATFAFDYPVVASHAADNIEHSALAAISSAFSPGQSSPVAATGSIEVDDVLYPEWVRGELGSATSATAVTYGQRLWLDQVDRWGQPATAAEVSAKEADFTAAAAAIKSSDPTAYRSLTGEGGGRTVSGLFALVAALITSLFQLIADVLVFASLLIIRLVVIFLPVLAVVGVHDRASGVVRGALTAVVAAVINSVVFFCGAALNSFVVATLLSPSSGLSALTGLLLSALMAALLWHVLRPFRHLTSLVNRSYSPVQEASDGVGRHASWLGRQAGFLWWSNRMATRAGDRAGEVAAESYSRQPIETSGPQAQADPAPTTTTGSAVEPFPETWSREWAYSPPEARPHGPVPPRAIEVKSRGVPEPPMRELPPAPSEPEEVPEMESVG